MTGNKLYGYAGKILRVNLSTRQISTQPVEEYARKWLGGRGINLRLLYEESRPGITPFEPNNPLIFGTGPMTGTLVPGSCRLEVASKNAFSNGIGSSDAGGFFAPEMKYAGYDHIVVTGRSKLPVYLWIKDEKVEIRDATGLWGKTTWETYEGLREELSDDNIQVASIGPAGENLVRSAAIIMNRSRAAAKCGLAAVMGSKNLKAIAVRGTGTVDVSDPKEHMQMVKQVYQKVDLAPAMQGMKGIGTMSFVPSSKGRLTTYKNFADLDCPNDLVEELGPENLQKTYYRAQMGCMACPYHCSQYYQIEDGPYAGTACEGFEMNTMVDFGTNIALYSAASIIKIHALCSSLGMDVDASSGAISWAFDAYERGILTSVDTDGLELKWGNHEAVCELLRKIAYREGLGNVLAEGAKRAAEFFGGGAAYFAMTQKGQDLYEDLRVPIGWAFGTALSMRAGGHTTSAPGAEVLFGDNPEDDEQWKRLMDVKTVDPRSYEDKDKMVVYQERQDHIMNSLILCLYVGVWFGPCENLLTIDDIPDILRTTTGLDLSKDDLVKIVDRIHNLEKAYNILHGGMGREADYPQDRFFDEPIKSGVYKGFKLSRKKYDKMLDDYYMRRGWDKKTGLPPRKTLEYFDLPDIARDLEAVGKLGAE